MRNCTEILSFYDDDLLKSVALEQETVSLIKEMVNLMNAGGFRLSKIINNNKNVMKTTQRKKGTNYY